jgi:RHS repeat-associated protein
MILRLRSKALPVTKQPPKRFRPRLFFLLCLLISSFLFLSPGFYGYAQAQSGNCSWATAKKWKVKMHLTQVLDKQGLIQKGDCSFDYVIALNHISDVTGTFSSTGTGGAYQGSLTSQETVNNRMDAPCYGDSPYCPMGTFYFTETGTGNGSEENVSLSIDPAMGKYTIAFPHTGITTTFVYNAPAVPGASFTTENYYSEINSSSIIDYLQLGLTASPSDPPTTFEFPLPGSSPKVITGEMTLQHIQYPEIPITWSWELTPDTGESDSELGSPEGKGKANGGAAGSGSGYGDPVWTVNMANLNLFITDTPLWYKSPIGPPVDVTVSYNSQAGVGQFEPIGRKWQLNYESYLSGGDVTRDSGVVFEVTIYMPDGRRDVYTLNKATNRFTPPYRVFNELKMTREGGIMEGNDYELTFPDGTVYVYKVPTGSLLWAFLHEIRDPRGKKLTLHWEGQSPWGGKLTHITDAMGRSTFFSYNSDKRVWSIRDPFGRLAYFDYDGRGNLTKITDMGSYYATFTYDDCGNLQSMIQGSNSWYFEPDATGLTVRNNLGSERFVLSAQGTVSYQGANAEAGTTYGYTQGTAPDGKHKDITGFQTPEGVGFKYEYDDKGNLLTDTLEAVTGNETATFTYNTKGKVTSVRDYRGMYTWLTYDPSNNIDLLELKDGLGTITATYNTKHDILSLTDRLGKTKYFSYNVDGQLLQTIDALGIVTNFIYDGDSRQLSQIVRAGTLIGTYGYDAIGRIASFTDVNGYTRRYVYNNIDDLLSISYPDGRTAVYERTTNVPHILKRFTDQAGRITNFPVYNGYKQLKEMNDPEGGLTRYDYDAAGHVTRLVDPNGNSTSFRYDKDNRLTFKYFADDSSNQFSYTNGRMNWSKNGRGIETRYTYDRNGNLLTILYNDATPGVTITYDDHNRPTRIEDGLGVHVKTYDANSRIETIDGPWVGDTLTFGYDDRGRKTSVALQNGLTVTYGYDSLDRLTSVAGNGLTYGYTYQSGTSLLEQLARPDGSRTEYAYDPTMKWLKQFTNKDRTGSILNEFTFSFDALGQPTGETVTNGPALQFMDVVPAAYTYNHLNQEATLDGSAGVFEYDADGNMTKGLTGDGLTFTAEYDAENRMTSIAFTDKSEIAKRQEFSYGHDGFLGIRKDYTNGALTGEKRFVRHAGKILQERNGTNGVEQDYLWGIAERGGVGALLALVRGGQTYQYFSNSRGDITAVLDSAGTVAAAYAYDPFGVPLVTAGTLDQPMRFSTKRYDEGPGLYDYGYRFYSPRLGHWLTRDPLSESVAINLYSFAGSNPIARFDPFGAADFSGLRPEDQAKAQAMYEAMQAKKEAEVTTGEKITRGIGAAFKWIGDKFKEHPEATKMVVDKVVDTALESNKYTKAGKEWNERINKGIELAEDYGTVKAALNDKDPASGLTLLKIGVKYSPIKSIPGVGNAYSEVMTKAIETVETAPGGVQASRRQHETGSVNANAARQLEQTR